MYPQKILNWIDDQELESASGQFFDKINPATEEVLAGVTRGNVEDVKRAVSVARKARQQWSQMPTVNRAEILREAVFLMRERKNELTEIVALESGKPQRDALNEVGAAIECGFFFAGEGRRYFGEVLQSSQPHREVKIIRASAGVGALITPFNNPSAGVAWKLFPALLCGNAVIIKSHEDVPYVAIWYAKIFKEAGLPSGVISVLQGFGPEVGAPLVENEYVEFISLTGSVETGRKVIKASADRLARVSIEAGGKNPFVVCDDADLKRAATLAVQAGFVDAGQRCVAASRIIIFDSVYEQFKNLFLEKVKNLKIGSAESDDYGAIINEKRMTAILDSVAKAVSGGAVLLTGGKRVENKKGFFVAPTVLESIDPSAEISQSELFGPVVILYKVRDFNTAVELANNSVFKLGSAIHTKSIHRAQEFISRLNAGVVRVNGPTHGSEPHMPFGGVGLSGNGWREPGTKALDFYSEWKQVSIDHDPQDI